MYHLAAYYESVDPSGAYANIAAVQDQALRAQGDDIVVPDAIPNIIGEVALTAANVLTAARLQSPALRRIHDLDMEPLVNAVVFGNPPEAMFHPMNPVPIDPDEALQLQINSTPAAGAEAHYGLVWLSDGPHQPVNGQIYQARFTASITLSAGAWVNGNITFPQVLPAGRYQVVGMRIRGTNLVAARLVFAGQTPRPGVPAVNAIGDRDATVNRYGRMGVFGEFDQNVPPTLDALGVTDTAQVGILDLIKVG